METVTPPLCQDGTGYRFLMEISAFMIVHAFSSEVLIRLVKIFCALTLQKLLDCTGSAACAAEEERFAQRQEEAKTIIAQESGDLRDL